MSTKTTVRVILTSEDKVLLLQKTKESKNPLSWEFPGGKVDEDTSIDAARNELMEETGISVDFEQFCFQDYGYSYSFERNGEINDRKVIFYSLVLDRIPSVELDKMDASEDNHAQYKWFTKAEYEKIFEKSETEGFSKENTLSANSKITPEKIFS